MREPVGDREGINYRQYRQYSQCIRCVYNTPFFYDTHVNKHMLIQSSNALIYALIGVTTVIILNRIMTPYPPNYSDAHISSIRALVNQATAWHGFATSRTTNTSTAHRLIYSSRAVACLSAARSTMPDADIEHATGIDVANLVHTLEITEVDTMRAIDGSRTPVPAWLQLGKSN